MSKKFVTIVLFRNTDLRIADNLTLSEAATKLSGGSFLPLYVWDKQFNGPLYTQINSESSYGLTWNFKFERTSRRRKKFLLSCLLDIQQTLKNRFQSDLIVIHPIQESSVVESLKLFLKSNEIENFRLYLGSDVPCFEENQLEKQLLKDSFFSKKIALVYNNHTMLKEDDLPFSSIQNLPDTYTTFRSIVEKKGRMLGSSPIGLVKPPVYVSSMLPLPSLLKVKDEMYEVLDADNLENIRDLIDVDDSLHAAISYIGGETSAMNRLSYYMSSGKISSYKKTRNGLLGQDYSSKLSPYLSFGCIGPRMIISQISDLINNGDEGAYWLWFELLWRDYFYFVAKKYSKNIFLPKGLASKISSASSRWNMTELGKNDPNFRAWSIGKTGVPFVDANMRELILTGYMSNRGRQNVASFLVKDLGLDWRLGAEWFESLLIDHDPCLNYGNWLYVAGLGNDPRQDDGKDGRYFNVVKQGRDYDPNAEYIITWCPELNGNANPHTPWISSNSNIGSQSDGYPSKPIVIGKGWDRYYSSVDNKHSNKSKFKSKFKKNGDIYTHAARQ